MMHNSVMIHFKTLKFEFLVHVMPLGTQMVWLPKSPTGEVHLFSQKRRSAAFLGGATQPMSLRVLRHSFTSRGLIDRTLLVPHLFVFLPHHPFCHLVVPLDGPVSADVLCLLIHPSFVIPFNFSQSTPQFYNLLICL